MKLGLLQKTHRDYDLECMDRYGDLFEGGLRFKRQVKHHLPKHDVEPPELYHRRCASAHYINYCAPIGSYFTSYLFSRPPVISAGKALPEHYTELREDCDGEGADLVDFLRDRFLEAVVKQRAFMRIELPEPETQVESRADFERDKSLRLRLVPIPAENVISWLKDKSGYVWMLDHEKTCELLDVGDPDETVTETWTQWFRTGEVRRWQIEYAKSHPPTPETVVPEVPAPLNPVRGIPIVELALPKALWLMSHLADPQLELFRKRCALSWAIDRTCYAMPILKQRDKKKPPAMGAGYYLLMGIDEDLVYAAPPAQPYDTIQTYINGVKDELHRVAQAMARGSNNDAATIGRSGESKMADDRATEIVLSAYGSIVRACVEDIFTLASEALGEDIEWDIGGLQGYTVVDQKSVIDNAIATETLVIPSATYKRKKAERIVRADLPELDEATMKDIMDELDKNFSNEGESMIAEAPAAKMEVTAPNAAGQLMAGEPPAPKAEPKPKAE
jgi:hypothetical protein